MNVSSGSDPGNAGTVLRTKAPSDVDHVVTLMKHRLTKDRKKVRLYFLRTFGPAFMLMLYTVGFFVGYQTDTESVVQGDFRLFPAEDWAPPRSLQIAGTTATFAENVSSALLGSPYYPGVNGHITTGHNPVTFVNETNSTAFRAYCEQSVQKGPTSEACVFLHDVDHYTILAAEGAGLSDGFLLTDRSLSAAQWAMNNAIFNVTGVQQLFPIDQIQKLPQSFKSEGFEASMVFTIIIGLLTVLPITLGAQFLLGPITFEKLQEIARSYEVVGVKPYSYSAHWFVYYSIHGLFTAVSFTAVSLVWKLYPMSSGGLIFVSHYLAHVHLYAVLILLGRIVTQEELAQGAPYLLLFFSAGVAVPSIIADSPILTVMTAVSPYIGVFQYCSIYVNYDTYGFGVGVHPSNIVESGLLGNMIAQLAGIILWLGLLGIVSSPNTATMFSSSFGRGQDNNYDDDDDDDDEGNNGDNGVPSSEYDGQPENFEALPPGSQVLLSVRNLHHTFQPGCCAGGKKPVEVLKGLDMDICRGEVFSYLGHNGAGKTTSIRLLCNELRVRKGNVTYNLRDGPRSLKDANDAEVVQSRIGVCPQHNNALQEDMTSREILRLFAQLKGRIATKTNQSFQDAIEAEVDRRLQDIKFTSEEDGDKPLGTYSGGMKRKVSIAMALLGDPEVVFLDEPTAGKAQQSGHVSNRGHGTQRESPTKTKPKLTCCILLLLVGFVFHFCVGIYSLLKGMDPYNRRTIWDMIIAAKAGRSIVLTTHFLDEADILSDRVGIIKDGKLITCGSTLFLKHHFGVGYTLRYESEDPVDVSTLVKGAERTENEAPGVHTWRLRHGTEPSFPAVLNALNNREASNVTLELTTLEQVFLATGKEDGEDETQEDRMLDEDLGDDADDDDDESMIDIEDPESKTEYLAKIWQIRGNVRPLRSIEKFFMVTKFMMSNAWKIKGTIFMNIAMPLTYLVTGMIVVYTNDIPESGTRVEPESIPITTFNAGNSPTRFFGMNSTDFPPIEPADTLTSIDQLTLQDDSTPPFIGGYFAANRTIQYNSDLTEWALQIGVAVLTNLTTQLNPNISMNGIATNVQQLPYTTETPFRLDLLLIPIVMAFGFVGLTFSVLDVLLLKGDNVFALFRVGGISEWSAYLGIAFYKVLTTFMPFFVLVIVLGLALGSNLFGNGGRWLAAIIIMLAYAYSTTPIGLILAKRFIRGNFKEVANWFPGLYMTFVSLPYTAWSIVLQVLPESRDTILIVGDFICLIPPVAFQRALGAVIDVSTKFDDPDLSWNDVWKFETRVVLAISMMIFIGTLEWAYLYRLASMPPQTTTLPAGQEELAQPCPTEDGDVEEERGRSQASDTGIRIRDIVKVFEVPARPGATDQTPVIKRAVKGVSYGVAKNEVYALLGPNGAGKSVTMNVLSGEFNPEHGEMVLDGRKADKHRRDVQHMYERCNISFCPQFDALFPKKTVLEHLRFYATVRGLDWNDTATTDHINAIVRLLGLSKHRNKESGDLSGGYKRRLSLGIAMIGYPHCVLVDECTTGLDPSARHLVWKVLKPETYHDEYDLPAILLSTHSMDEASKLGTRIGIMIDGELVTTGSLDRLQERYCTSYFVEVSLSDTVDPAKGEEAVIGAFEDQNMSVEVYESLPYKFKLRVPFVETTFGHGTTRQLADIFALLESSKMDLSINMYSVAQMSLEQIFIDLSRKQFSVDNAAAAIDTIHGSGRFQ